MGFEWGNVSETFHTGTGHGEGSSKGQHGLRDLRDVLWLVSSDLRFNIYH